MVSDSHTQIMARVEPVAVQTQRMHPLVDAAIATGALDPTSLRELLAVQREWEAGEARKAYTRALAGLKRDLPTVIGRDQTVDYTNKAGQRTRYTHTSLAAVMDAITEPLTQHGFALSWTPSIADRAVRVTCRLTHTEGHFEEATLEAPADTSGNKNPAQAIASTQTLLSRYTALGLLGIATADMKEPAGESREERDPATSVDPGRNLRAAAKLTRRGRSREDAERFVGRPIAEWTGADIDRLAEWVERPRRPSVLEALESIAAAADADALVSVIMEHRARLLAHPDEARAALAAAIERTGADPMRIEVLLEEQGS